jgi:putative copper resistance protein D
VALPPFSASTLVSEAAPDPLGLTVLVLGSVGYAVGVHRLADRGRDWPVTRSLAFAAAMVAFAMATMSGLAAYDTERFSAHMAQHLLLGMVVPVLLVVARPLTLALQASSRPTQVALLRALHHPVVRFVSRPVVALVAFTATLWVLYFTPLYDLSLRSDPVHLLVHVHFVVVGVLFYGAVLATDPRPVEASPATRAALTFVAVPLHAFLGMALLAGPSVVDDVSDQRLGAGLLLSVGELVGLAVLLAVVWRWMGAEDRAADRELRAAS